MQYKVKLIKVGRSLVTLEFETKNCFGITEAELFALSKIRKNIMSRNVWLDNESNGKYEVFVGFGMGRKVGEVSINEIKRR